MNCARALSYQFPKKTYLFLQQIDYQHKLPLDARQITFKTV